MFKALTCIPDTHHLGWLAVAIAICGVAVLTGFSAYRRACDGRGRARVLWSLFAGLVTGCGVWAMHFLSMLASQPGLLINYGFALTALSLAAVVVILACGFLLAAQSRRRLGRGLGGAVIGFGVAAMHFVGIAAMSAKVLAWDAPMTTTALLIGVALAAAAMGVLGRCGRPWRQAAACALLMVGIVGLHFTAMGAIILAPDPQLADAARSLQRGDLMLGVAGVMGLILAISAAMLLVATSSAKSALRSVESALSAAPEAIAFVDRAGRLTFWNQRYADLPDPPATTEVDAAPREIELPDGRTMRTQSSPTPDGGHVVVVVDVTSARQAQKFADEARERAEAASRMKSEFLANMSHEIRTPLNGVLGMAHVMEAHPLARDQRDRLGVIIASGQGLLTLLNDILDLAKAEAGDMAMEDIAFDITATLQPILEGFAATAALKNLSFRVNIADTARGAWQGDPERLRQIVSNLVSNAVKFTAAGAVTVDIARSPAGLRVEVTDTGIGIEPQHMSRLFETFAQADSSSTRRFGGAGLGLAIASRLARRMGGDITASSLKGQGSRFIFEAPLTRPVTSLARSSDPVLSAGTPLRVLVAEDNAINRQVLAGLLEPLGADVTPAKDGAEAIAAYRAGGFDLVLMDIQMPVLGGIAASLAIRAWEAANGRPRTPILAVTANVMAQQVGSYLEAGMDGVISKPIRPRDLYAELQKALRVQEAA